MSKFLKFLVNLFLICSIVVTASLLIPPLAGVTTNIIDTVNMDTNLPFGSVTYSSDVTVAELAEGDKILVDSGNSIYVYKVQSGDASTGEFTVLDAMDKSSETTQVKLRNPVYRVILTVPFTGYIVVAMQSVEGFIIIILVLVFVAILFILSELWKKSDEDDEDDEEEEEHESRRERKARLKAEKEARKEAEREAAETGKSEKKSVNETAAQDPVQRSIAEPGERISRPDDFSEISEQKVIPSDSENVIQTAGGDFSELQEDDVKIYTPKRAASAAMAGSTVVAAAEQTGSDERTEEERSDGMDAQASDGLFPGDYSAGSEGPAPAGLFSGDSAIGSEGPVPTGLFREERDDSRMAEADESSSGLLFPESRDAGNAGGSALLFPKEVSDAKAAGAEAPAVSLLSDAPVVNPPAYDAPVVPQAAPMPAVQEAPAASAPEIPAQIPSGNDMPRYGDPQAAGLVPETAAPQDPDHFTPVERPTLEEIVEQARKKGLNPDIRRDSITNINLVDFSDLL